MNIKHLKIFRDLVFINGIWQGSKTSKSFSVFNPADGTQIAVVPDCGKEETIEAINSAAAAFLNWKKLPAKARSDYLKAWAALIDQHKEDLAILMTAEQGKPLKEARGEIEYANRFLTWFAEEGRRIDGDIIQANDPKQRILVLKEPLGVVGVITPWNFPAAMITRKLGALLAAGCTAVIKPAEETPLTAIALMVLAEKAGFPKGVLNLITGDPVPIGRELTENPLVKKISFTGSTAVGKLLMQQSASTVKKLSLELGGNAPFIVFKSADLEVATDALIKAKFRNSGQTCVCANRVYVEHDIYEPFILCMIEKVKGLRIGKGDEDNIDLGPLINQAALEKVEKHVADALSKGAELLLGGCRHKLGGLFYEPTVLSNANSSMLLAHEETFGPVVPLFSFKHESEVIALANDSEYGLAAYFCSRDSEQIWRVAESLETGIVGINVGIISTEVAPFGGVKQSGIGREGSKYGIDEYLELKYVCWQLF